jgi:molecular chaperone GrpE
MTSAPEREGDHHRSEADGRGSEASADVPPQQGEQPRSAAEAEEQAVSDDLDRLLEDVRRERDEYLDLAKRAKADFENYRKRAAREATEAERRGKATLARELLPVIDNLERALRAGDESESAGAGGDPPGADQRSAHEALVRGVALVLDELRGTLERAGVEAYDPVGERFDPTWHEALQTRSVDGAEAGVVVETLERGYRLDGQVLRAARVVVSE